LGSGLALSHFFITPGPRCYFFRNPVDKPPQPVAIILGVLSGPGLDVYELEPDVHPKLLKQKNAVLLPHIASATISTRAKMADMAVENIIQFIKGKTPPNRVA